MELSRAKMISEDLIRYHVSGWNFKFDRAVVRLGYTHFPTKTISLSEYATSVNPEENVINTILHEIAHALVGPNHGHDYTWVSQAKGIGCTGKRCGQIVTMAPAKYTVKCIACGHSFFYYRKPVRIESKYHSKCGREKGRLALEVA